MNAPPYSFLWNEEATEEEVVEGYQDLINTGMAWRLEGHVGRTAKSLIEAGLCTLGPRATRDFYGNVVPGVNDVVPGTEGSPEYAEARRAELEEL